MHRVRVGDHFGICHEAIGCTYSEKKSIKHKNTKGGDFVSCTVLFALLPAIGPRPIYGAKERPKRLALNNCTVPDCYPIPHIQDFTATLHDKSYFLSLI